MFEKSTLAVRAGGGKVWGYYPFYDAMFLGGSENLRAYTRARYSGDASLFGQIELRSKLTELKIIMKGDFGFNLFAGTGRVFTQNNKSSVWHNSLGLGLWASYFNRKFVFNGSFAYSKEEYNFYVDMAMGF